MAEKKRVAVLVSGGGTNLQAILDAQKSGIITSGEVTIVISNKQDAYALTRAKNAGISNAVIKNETELTELLDIEKADLIVLAGYLSILSSEFTKRYEGRIINVHPSLIPSFCGKGCYGLKVHRMALEKGVKVTGATVHFVNEIPDGGEIIDQRAVYIKEGDTPELLQRRVMEEAEWIILPRAIEKICAGLQ